MNDAAKQPDKELDLERRIAQLRQLRAKIKGIEDRHKEELDPYETAKKALEGALMQWLLDRKIKTANTEAGKITWVDNTTYPIEDLLAFQDYVTANKAWEMLDWKANKTSVVGYINEHKDPTNPTAVNLPPGLRENPHPHLRVTPPAGKKTPTKHKGFDIDAPEEE